jgi:hypothetical protein
MDSISAMGFFFGYMSGAIMVIITLGVLMMSPDLMGMKVAIFLTGLWWFVFTLPMVCFLHKRPGPPLPNASPLFYFTFSAKRLFASMSCLKHIPQTRRFMIAYFLYSDAYSTIASVSMIFAVDEMGMEFLDVSRAPPKTSPAVRGVGGSPPDKLSFNPSSASDEYIFALASLALRARAKKFCLPLTNPPRPSSRSCASSRLSAPQLES